MNFQDWKKSYLRQQLLKKHPKGPPARLKRLIHPETQVARYTLELEKLLRFAKSKVDARIVPLLPKLVDHYKRERKDADDDGSAGPGDYFAWFQGDLTSLADQLESVRLQVTQEYTKDEIKRLAMLTGTSVAEWNARQMNGQLKGIAEIDLFGSEPWLGREMGAFVQSNVDLITSLPDQYLDQVGQMVATSVRSGLRVEEIAKNLYDRFDVSESRARLIARDQIGKFNGQLTELRQKDVGVKGYIWRGVGDSRERPTHLANNNRRFTWDDPPATGHPGDDIQCRCWAEPDLSGVYGDDQN